LVQETDVFAAVRGARIVLADGGPVDDGVRAPMTAHWLAQLGWEVAWLTDVQPALLTETGAWRPAGTPLPDTALIQPEGLAAGADRAGTLLLDLASSAQYVQGHIPGACWVLRTGLAQALGSLPELDRIVLTSPDGELARWAAADLAAATAMPVAALAGGTAAWARLGMPMQQGETTLASPRIDRYRRPYEGTDAPREAMQAYLDWEFGLVAQLARDGTHGFRVLGAA
jgi:rhodanese-related sulfurtransferase